MLEISSDSYSAILGSKTVYPCILAPASRGWVVIGPWKYVASGDWAYEDVRGFSEGRHLAFRLSDGTTYWIMPVNYWIANKVDASD